MAQLIARGILISFDRTTYTASVLMLEATSSTLKNVPVSTHIDGSSAQVGTLCAVFFFDAHNSSDAVVLAVFPNGAQGIPAPPPGRMVFITSIQQINASVISVGTTSTFTMSGLPPGILGIIYKVFFSSATQGAFIQLAPHAAADITAYSSVGVLPAANTTLHGMGVLQVDAASKIDIKANMGTCTVTLYTHGYVM